MFTILALTYSDNINFGNVLTMVVMAIGAIGAYFDLKSRSVMNKTSITSLKDRFDNFEPEKVSERVNTMWAFQLRRGFSEVEINNLGKINSPVVLSARAESLIEPLVPDLRAFYQEVDGPNLSLVDLASAIESKFGERLAREVCIPANIHDAACLIIAMSKLRPVSPKHLTAQCSKTITQ